MNSNEKHLNYDFHVFTVKIGKFFVIWYFSMIFGCFFIRPDPDV